MHVTKQDVADTRVQTLSYKCMACQQFAAADISNSKVFCSTCIVNGKWHQVNALSSNAFLYKELSDMLPSCCARKWLVLQQQP